MQKKQKRWIYDHVKEVFVCRVCGYTHQDPGGITMHSLRAHEGIGGVKKKEPGAKKELEKQKKIAGGPVGCQHSFRLLSPALPAQARALAAGYAYYCTECEEVKA